MEFYPLYKKTSEETLIFNTYKTLKFCLETNTIPKDKDDKSILDDLDNILEYRTKNYPYLSEDTKDRIYHFIHSNYN